VMTEAEGLPSHGYSVQVRTEESES
jgi:hypothetical protein